MKPSIFDYSEYDIDHDNMLIRMPLSAYESEAFKGYGTSDFFSTFNSWLASESNDLQEDDSTILYDYFLSFALATYLGKPLSQPYDYVCKFVEGDYGIYIDDIGEPFEDDLIDPYSAIFNSYIEHLLSEGIISDISEAPSYIVSGL